MKFKPHVAPLNLERGVLWAAVVSNTHNQVIAIFLSKEHAASWMKLTVPTSCRVVEGTLENDL